MHDCFAVELTDECLKCSFRLTRGGPYLRGVIGSTVGAYPRGTGSNPVEGNGHFFPSYRQLYLFVFLWHTHTHAHTRTHAHTHFWETILFLLPSFFFLDKRPTLRQVIEKGLYCIVFMLTAVVRETVWTTLALKFSSVDRKQVPLLRPAIPAPRKIELSAVQQTTSTVTKRSQSWKR